MATRANISPGYRWRLGIIGLFCLGFACWSFYDGYVKYPRQRHIAQTFQQIKQEHPLDFTEHWQQRAKAEGWPLDDPGKPKGDWDIYSQYLMLAITLPVGLIFGISFLRSGSRWIEMDEDGLKTSWNQAAPFIAITGLNKERWYNKGIATLRYESEEGIERTLVLDDWKFDRHAIEAMVEQVQSLLRPDQVIGHREKPDEADEQGASAQQQASVEQDGSTDQPTSPGDRQA